jgi:hypothetical protein
MLPILPKLLLTSGTFLPDYVTDLLTASNLASINILAKYLKNRRKLAQNPTGMVLVKPAPLGLRGLCP